jgi:Tol biopolymer transport system component
VGHSGQVWVFELDGGRRTRLTQQGISIVPLFSPDSSRIVFGSYQPEENLYSMASDGSGGMELLLESVNRQYPIDWHEASGRIVLQWTDPDSGYDIWTVGENGEDAAPFLATPHNERWASLSPDGRWMAYASDESGRYEIYVVSYPDGRGKRAVSTDGGIDPRWSSSGREIFFVAGGVGELYRDYTEMKTVAVTLGTHGPEIGSPRPLFEGDYVAGMCCGHNYDVTPDGQRFVMIKSKPESERHIIVELNALDDAGRPVYFADPL